MITSLTFLMLCIPRFVDVLKLLNVVSTPTHHPLLYTKTSSMFAVIRAEAAVILCIFYLVLFYCLNPHSPYVFDYASHWTGAHPMQDKTVCRPNSPQSRPHGSHSSRFSPDFYLQCDLMVTLHLSGLYVSSGCFEKCNLQWNEAPKMI